MILVIGGAYQGKFDFVKENYNIKDEEIFFCNENDDFINFQKKVIKDFHKFALNIVKKEKSPFQFVKENITLFNDKIIICDEISSGIVPIDYHQRILREELGRCLVTFSKNSTKVVRLFCGIPTDLK